MEIDHDIAHYAVSEDVSIAAALDQINTNSSRIVFTLDRHGRLTGVLSDGDLRRWLLARRTIDTNQPVSIIAKKEVVTGRIDGRQEEWQPLFSEAINLIPLIDETGRLHAVARPRKLEVRIGKHKVGDNEPAFVIAEIGNNHNGDFELAKQLVDAARIAGADCAKFQLRQLEGLYRTVGEGVGTAEDLGAEYTLDLLRKFSLSDDDLFRVFDYCHETGIEPLCTPWDKDSVAALESYGMNAFKVASADLTNHELLTRIAAVRRPMVVSTGMSSEDEIVETANILRRTGANYAFLHCNSTYPAPYRDINLAYMDRLREIGQCPVGYSGHERGIHIAIAAVARGARIVEKHFTLDRSLEGSDHKISLLPEELRTLVGSIRDTEAAIGNKQPRTISQGEMLNRSSLAKSLVAKRDIQQGESITPSMLDVKSPGRGLQPNKRTSLIGRRARHAIPAGEYIYERDIDAATAEPRSYVFDRPWGIPVRYHDWRALTAATNPDLIEFHFSYRDLDVDYREHLAQSHDLDFVIHCPELFAGDHILDLCSPSEDYRQRSLAETQRVINLTRSIAPRFPKTKRPPIVINVGGFSETRHLEKKEKHLRRDKLFRSLDELDTAGIELLPQTMPPFPWHFGGQRFHNIFVDPYEIRTLCEERQLRLCLDISHAKLACAHIGMQLDRYVEIVGPYIAHLHIADAGGSDREGLQIGDGDINFRRLATQLSTVAPHAGFIPEIWQGHVATGSGFWTALERLEPAFSGANSGQKAKNPDSLSTPQPARKPAGRRRARQARRSA